MSKVRPATTRSACRPTVRSRSAQGEQTIRLAGKQRSGVSLPISANAAGIGNVAIRVSGPNGFEMQRSYTLAAKPATQMLTRRTVRPIAKGESITIVERPVRRPGAGHRRRAALGRSLDRARRRGAAQGARPLSVRLHRADHQPRAAAALCQRARERGAARARHRDRPAHPRRDRAASGAPGLERLVRPVGRRAATTCGSTPT